MVLSMFRLKVFWLLVCMYMLVLVMMWVRCWLLFFGGSICICGFIGVVGLLFMVISIWFWFSCCIVLVSSCRFFLGVKWLV